MDVQGSIKQIQAIEQHIQQLLVQKRSLQSERIELESALEELTDDADAFKLVGNIMVKADASTLREDLSTKKQRLDKRVQAFEDQEQKLREKAQSLQKQVMENMEHDQD